LVNNFRTKSDIKLDIFPDGPLTTHTFSVEGMTCSSCESSLKDFLNSIPQIHLVSVSVVLSRAVVETSLPPEHIIKIAMQKTGFKMTLLENSKQPSLYLRFTGERKNPRWKGLLGVNVMRRGATLKFTFDAHQISAREIYEYYTTQGLAPEILDSFPEKLSKWNTLGARVLASIILAIPVLIFAYTLPHPPISGSIQLLLVTLILLYVMLPLYRSAITALLNRHEIEMDLLVVMSTSIAYGYSLAAFAIQCSGGDIGDAFWETPALLVTLIMLGRWIVLRARERAVSEVKRCSETKVSTARLVVFDDSEFSLSASTSREVDIRLLGYGDSIRTDPGEQVPSDGQVTDGESEVNQAMFTGESTPVPKKEGDPIYAGSINLLSPLTIKINSLPSSNTLSSIRNLITSSQISKPHIQSYTDRLAGYLGPLALFCALTAFITWTLVNLKLQGQEASKATVGGLMYAIAVLAVTCPCTIGLAVPLNIVIASGIAAKAGILIKDAGCLEVLHRNSLKVVFDKTGTLTMGEMKVVCNMECGENAREYVKGLVRGQKHPVAKAVEKYLDKGTVNEDEGKAKAHQRGFDQVQVIIGCGLEVKLPEGILRGGSPQWLGIPNPLPEGKRNLSVLAVTLNGELIAAYGLTDELRSEAKEVVSTLHKRGVEVYIVSGDNKEITEEVGIKLDIPVSRVYSGSLPAEKAVIIRQLQQPSQPDREHTRRFWKRKDPAIPVLFIGDGINDAPALSASTIPISFINASELTLSTASVLLLNPHLTSLLTLITLSRRVYRRVIITFVWAGVYNLFAILLAAGAFVVWRIEARWAGVGEVVSVLPVILVGWSLRWKTRW
jgi:Cd2+-exporting ATPase